MAAAAEAARLRDTPPTDPADALDFWRARLAEDPSNGIARAEVAALLEADGRFEQARATLLAGRSVEKVASDGGNEARHLARLSLWMGRPQDAARRVFTRQRSAT